MRRLSRDSFFVLAIALLANACGKTSNNAAEVTDAGDVCVPGMTQSCVGPGQCPGAQVCNDSGSKWGTCDCGSVSTATGGQSGTGGKSSTGGSAATGGAATGGNSPTGGGPAAGTGGSSDCSVASVTPGKDYTHPVYGHGYIWGDSSTSDYWVKFDSGLQYDHLTGYGWYQLDGFYDQAETSSRCGAATVANITGWKLPTITQARTLAAGCAPTVTGGSCPLSDSCLTYSCGFTCGSCLGGASGTGPHNCAYCRATVWPCLNFHTSSNCPDCASYGYQTEWVYGPGNGNVGVSDPTYRITGLCVVTSVPKI